jgi:hypothetical protein
MATPKDAASIWDPRVLRTLWFEALSEAMDAYLRSTAFLELMQCSLRPVGDAGPSQDDASRPPHAPPDSRSPSAPASPPADSGSRTKRGHPARPNEHGLASTGGGMQAKNPT